MVSYPQTAHSWTLLSDKIAVKRLDKSSFLHHWSGIPKEIVMHFTSGAQVLPEGTPVTLVHEDTKYPARLQYDAQNQRVRLFWKSDFVDVLKGRLPEAYRAYSDTGEVDSPPLMILTKREDQVFAVTFVEPTLATNQWSDIELEGAVIAYFNMLRKEQERVPYSKAEMNRQLREVILSTRNKQSVEFRMANISSVLEELCHPIIKGYKPRGHVGAGVSSRIKKALETHHLISLSDHQPTVDQQELEKRTHVLLKRGIVGKPKGQKKPRKSSTSSSNYERDPAVRAWVLKQAEGTCELCGKSAPFRDQYLEPFLEVHHVRFLANEGEDTIENAVALCPNCHREAHYSGNVAEVADRIRSTVSRITEMA